MSEREYYLAFSLMPGVGPKKFDLLLKNYGTAEKAWNDDSSLLNIILGEKLLQKFVKFKSELKIEEHLFNLKKEKADYICLSDNNYPENLKKIPNPPIVIYTKGNKELLKELEFKKSLAIVGTRRVTSYGKKVTEIFSTQLSSSEIIIISGLAIGVDGIAHEACLSVSGKTIAVLGNGVDLCYPRENMKIYNEILNKNGLIISEMPLGEKPSIGSFPSRNRIVAGLSDGILVTEGAEDSGSLITANFGLEFKRKVFAIPGPITSSLSAAPLRLIEKGAKLVVTSDDVIKELGVIKLVKKSINLSKHKDLTKEESLIVNLLQNETLSFDEITRRLKIDSSKTGIILSMMEMKGLIKNLGGEFVLSW